MHGLVNDLRYGLRSLARQPIISAVAVITLALGIGANTAIFSLLDAIMLRPLPVRDPSGLLALQRIHSDGHPSTLSLEMFRLIADRQKAFSMMAGWTTIGATTEIKGTTAPSQVDGVTGNYFSLLGVRPTIGRLIQPEDEESTNGSLTAVAVASYSFWRDHYNRNKNILGETIDVQGIPFTIVGVAPPDYFGLQVGLSTDLTIPMPMMEKIQQALNMGTTQVSMDYALGRLRPGVRLKQARLQIESVWPSIRSATIQRNTVQPSFRSQEDRIVVDSVSTGFSPLRTEFSKSLVILLLIAGLVLLLTCLNLATSLLARGAARSYEMAVRAALGASRWRLSRQILIESILLSAFGGLLGLWLAYFGSQFLVNMLTQLYSVMSAWEISPDRRILAFCSGIAILTGVLIGIGPAWRAAREEPRGALQEGRPSMASWSPGIGKGLVVTQVALSIVLLETAVLFVGSLAKLHTVPLGFQTHNRMEVQLAPRARGYDRLNEIKYYRALAESLATLPGVISVSMSNMTPGAGFEPLTNVARGPDENEGQVSADIGLIAPGFFRTMGMSLLGGRDFTWEDDTKAGGVAIISQGLAQALFATGNCLGREIKVGQGPGRSYLQIVGLVDDARISDVHRPQHFSVFLPSMQGPRGSMEFPTVEVATAGGIIGLRASIRREVNAFGREYVSSIFTAEQIINLSLVRERMTAMLSAFFAQLAVLLAAIGLFGLISYTVTQRKREIAIRLAVGASLNSIRKMILKETLILVLEGVAIGAPCAMLVSRSIASVTFGMPAGNFAALTAVCLAIIAIGLVAGYLPARQATHMDPMSILRHK